MIKQGEQLFTIQQISLNLDIPKSTLRFWEKELEGIIDPLRTLGGQRRYTAEHITILEQIKGLRDSGKSLSEIKSYLNKGQNRNNDLSVYGNIDLLSDRIAEVVKTELYDFFQNREVIKKL